MQINPNTKKQPPYLTLCIKNAKPDTKNIAEKAVKIGHGLSGSI